MLFTSALFVLPLLWSVLAAPLAQPLPRDTDVLATLTTLNAQVASYIPPNSTIAGNETKRDAFDPATSMNATIDALNSALSTLSADPDIAGATQDSKRGLVARGLDIDAVVQVLVSITANINLIVDAGGDCGCDQGLISDLIGTVDSLLANIFGTVQVLIPNLLNLCAQLFVNLNISISVHLSAVLNLLGGLIDGLLGTVGGVVDGLGNTVEGVTDGLGGVVSGLGNFLGGLLGGVGGLLGFGQ